MFLNQKRSERLPMSPSIREGKGRPESKTPCLFYSRTSRKQTWIGLMDDHTVVYDSSWISGCHQGFTNNPNILKKLNISKTK